MKTIPAPVTHLLQILVISCLGLGIFLAVSLGVGEQPVHALPEYTERTGEPCAACHVNPGGGGPRTLRGLLWGARGRPETLPQLPGMLAAPGIDDGQELYEIACAGCHGYQSEGLYASGLAGRNISDRAIRSFIEQGIPLLGMPSFDKQFEEDQLDALIRYVGQLARGEIPPPQQGYLLPPASLGCPEDISTTSCGGD
jgi:mono/diheme cytochrome c family protein